MKNEIYIYGKHSVFEALENAPNSVKKIFLSSSIDDKKILDSIRISKIEIVKLSEKNLPKDIDEAAVHQGIIAVISLRNLIHQYKDFTNTLNITPDTALVLLNEVQDPQNVGAIIRSAAAFGISGVLIPEYNQAQMTGSVIKVSAGMAFRIPLVSVGNENHTIEDLKKRGFWIYGLEGEGNNLLSEEKFTHPSVFVLGNEGRGIRAKTKEHCDILLSIPINKKCESLNVASSASVTFYQWSLQHPGAINF